MASNPQQSLPWVQTIAGLIGGLNAARQQQMQNPRFGYSVLPVVTGAAQGLLSGWQGMAQQQELLRQESMAQQGNIGAAQTYGIKNPEALRYTDRDLLKQIITDAGGNLRNIGTGYQLPQAQMAGLKDAGARGTGNEPIEAKPESVLSLYKPIAELLAGKALGKTSTQTPLAGALAPLSQVLAPTQTQTNTPALQASADMTQLAQPVTVPGIPALPEMTLAEMALQGGDPKTLVEMYSAARGAANDLNSQDTQRLVQSMAQTGQNERAVLDYQGKLIPDTIAELITGGGLPYQRLLRQTQLANPPFPPRAEAQPTEGTLRMMLMNAVLSGNQKAVDAISKALEVGQGETVDLSQLLLADPKPGKDNDKTVRLGSRL